MTRCDLGHYYIGGKLGYHHDRTKQPQPVHTCMCKFPFFCFCCFPFAYCRFSPSSVPFPFPLCNLPCVDTSACCMLIVPLSRPHTSAMSTSEHAALTPLGSACCACARTPLFARAHITRLPCQPCKFFYFLLFYLAHSCFRAQHCPLPSCRSPIPTCYTLCQLPSSGISWLH